MKLNWGRTALASLGAVGDSLIWTTYNLFVPILLQSGRPDFTGAAIAGFGLSTGTTGLVMTLDNVIAVLLVPVVGLWSDRVGKRYPFILGSLPVIALCFALVPLPLRYMNDPGMGIGANPFSFTAIMLVIGLMLIGMTVYRTPARALINDLTPSPLRSKANGVAEFMRALAAVTASLLIAQTFDIALWLPFVITAAALIAVTLTMTATVREPEETSETELEGADALATLRNVGQLIPKETRFSLTMMLVAVFAFTFGFNALETFYSSYAVNTLGVTAGEAARLFAAALVAFVVGAIPAGFLGERIGRKVTITLGLLIFAGALGAAYVIPGLDINAPVLIAGGIAWALIIANALPLVVDSAQTDKLIGTYTALYYVALQGASVASPIVTGTVIDAFGGDFDQLLLVTTVAFSTAVLAMLFVRGGEAQPRNVIDR